MAQKNNLTIQVVSIIGGILTAIFFLGFLVVASIIRTETSSLIIGCLFIITTLTISRRLTVPFLDAMNITLYIAGCALIAYGLNKSTNALFIALAITGIFTFFLSKGFILPFLSVILFIISRRVSLFIFVNTTFANSSSPGFSSFPVHQSIRKGYPDRIKGKLSFQIHTFPFRLIRFLYLLISRIVC